MEARRIDRPAAGQSRKMEERRTERLAAEWHKLGQTVAVPSTLVRMFVRLGTVPIWVLTAALAGPNTVRTATIRVLLMVDVPRTQAC